MLSFPRARRAWLAGLLQFFVPGLGNVYSGRPYRGVVVYLLAQAAFTLVMVAALLLPETLNLVIPVVGLLTIATLVVLDGIRSARAARPDFQLAPYNRWYFYLLLYIGNASFQSFVVAETLKTHVVQAAQIVGPSMEPALLPGDHFLVNMSAYVFSEPTRGDLVVFSPSGKPGVRYVQRIIGLPGETIEIREKSVYVNFRKLDEPYVKFIRPSGSGEAAGDFMDSIVLADDEYFLLGDNRDNSNDSRFSGPVPRKQIHAKPRMLYFSWNPENQTARWERMGLVLE